MNFDSSLYISKFTSAERSQFWYYYHFVIQTLSLSHLKCGTSQGKCLLWEKSAQFVAQKCYCLGLRFQNVLEYVLSEMEELAKHGITLPPNMQGLTDEQLSDLNLHDDWEDECVPSGGVIERKDPLGRRNGKGTLT